MSVLFHLFLGLKLIGGVQVLPAGAMAGGGRAAVIKECVPKIDEKKGTKKDSKASSEFVTKDQHQYSQVTKRKKKLFCLLIIFICEDVFTFSLF